MNDVHNEVEWRKWVRERYITHFRNKPYKYAIVLNKMNWNPNSNSNSNVIIPFLRFIQFIYLFSPSLSRSRLFFLYHSHSQTLIKAIIRIQNTDRAIKSWIKTHMYRFWSWNQNVYKIHFQNVFISVDWSVGRSFVHYFFFFQIYISNFELVIKSQSEREWF